MKENKGNQSVSVTDRSSAVLTGVEEVISYDENNIVMQTSLGQLTLDGEGLNIVQLNLGEGIVSVEGRIDALYYMEQRERKSLFSRIFG
ncbi:MAG: YabP/YqfC family sporulation protein [Clostridia bacterium]|nr:YabP/YqfC family sporulation protein [Clostridia bacterium]MBQ4602752.1 YabP/YqfC family sporulation protein [Clostridia bacterium]